MPKILLVLFALVLTACGVFGVERFQSSTPHPGLRVYREFAGGSFQLETTQGQMLEMQTSPVLTTSEMDGVRNLESIDGGRELVLVLNADGRARLSELLPDDGASAALVFVVEERIVLRAILRGPVQSEELVLSRDRSRIEELHRLFSAN